MDIIKKIESNEELDQICFYPFLVSRVDLLDFDYKIAYVINSNLFTSLRNSIKNNVPLDQLIVFPEDVINDREIQYLTQLYSEMKFYPFSRKEFYAAFLSNLIPSLADFVYNHLKSTNRIIPIGSGQHKGFVINAKSFKDESLPAFPVYSYSFDDLIEQNQNLLQSLSHYAQESSFYEDAIRFRDQHIQDLYAQIDALQNQINSLYQTTWR
jgi:hypothetical protein